MPQITLYLPRAVADQVRRRAKRANKSVSAYVGELLARDIAPAVWPKGLVDLLTRGGADLREPDDPPPEDVEPL